MGSAIPLRNVVRIAEHAFLVAVVPLQGSLYANALVHSRKVKYRRVDRVLVTVQVLDERANAALILKHVLALVALIDQVDADAGIQKRQLPQSPREDVIVELDVGKGIGAWFEPQRGPGAVGLPYFRQRRLWLTVHILLLVGLAFTMNGQRQLFGQRIHHRHANAVQASGDLVGVVVKLPAGVQHGHDDLRCGPAFFGMFVDRDAATVIRDRDGFVGVNRNRDDAAMTGERLVDRVIDDLENHMVQPGAVIGVTDVHSGPLANGLKAL